MKAHTSEFKENIKKFGKELDSKIIYTINGTTTELGNEQLNSVTPHYEGGILKSVMKQLDIDSNVEIPLGTILTYQFGVKVGSGYEYINFGNYIVYKAEKQEDTDSWQITCYDKMLYSMTNYVSLNITYPITIRNYINTICTYLGITFANASSTFANYDKQLTREMYLSYNEETQTFSSLGYTFRDVLDELAQVTASTICINDNDQLEIRYIQETVGNNLVKISDQFRAGSSASNITPSINANGELQVVVASSNGNWHTNWWATGQSFNDIENTLSTGDTFTISFTIKKSSSTDTGKPTIYIKQGMGYYTMTGTVGTEYSELYYTGTWNDTNGIAFHLGWGSCVGTFTIKNWQLKKGTYKPYEPYGDTIDEEYLKDVNVNFGEKFGPVNTIVLSRSAESDNVYYPSTLPANPIEIKITDNQIMNDNNRATYLPDIYAKLNGLEYYINDFSSTGICYYDLCDKYNIKVGDKFYSCIMFNDEVNITQGLKEEIYTDMPEDTNTEYSKADATDRKINGAYIMADKANARIDAVTRQYDNVNGRLNKVEDIQTATSKQINVISQNVTYEYDPDTGEPISSKINSVETIKGFTFDENGLTIANNQTDYKSVQDETGTYYYDGNTIVGEYTKDGSKQKDLHLFGVYYYGMKSKDETPMFVAQLYTDNNNEECFGHFYNRGD